MEGVDGRMMKTARMYALTFLTFLPSQPTPFQ